MESHQLPEETRTKLDELVGAIDGVLKSVSTPHMRVVSYGWMDNGFTDKDVLTGGSIVAPGKPPLTYDKKGIQSRHRAVLQSGGGVLFGLVVIGERADGESPWQLRTKLVSRDEHAALVQSRKPIDEAVERELKKRAVGDWEWVSFGRDSAKNAVRAVLRDSSGLKDLDVTPSLLDLLKMVDQLYAKSGLELKIADWTLGPGGLEFREYYE